MADQLMYILKDNTQITPSLDYNFLTLKLMNQPIKIQDKSPTNKKTLL